MGFDLSSVFSGGTKGIFEGIKSLVGEFHLSPEERQKFLLKSEALVTERMKALQDTAQKEAEAKAKIIQAEMQSGDVFTKRARPSVVYAGLAYIGINNVLFPILIRLMAFWASSPVDKTLLAPLPPLPAIFWQAWGGICATWVVSRSWERVKGTNKLTSIITGTK